MRTVPVLARGSKFVHAQRIDEVADFVRLPAAQHVPLPPPALIERWLAVLTHAQSVMRQMPPERLGDEVAPGREGRVLAHGYHVFRIAEGFLSAVAGRESDWVAMSMKPPPPELRTSDQVAAYGEEVKEKLTAWWAGASREDWSRELHVVDGTWKLHPFLERQVWHSLHHTRQLESLLERYGVEPEPRIPQELLQDLPLPKAVWT